VRQSTRAQASIEEPCCWPNRDPPANGDGWGRTKKTLGSTSLAGTGRPAGGARRAGSGSRLGAHGGLARRPAGGARRAGTMAGWGRTKDWRTASRQGKAGGVGGGGEGRRRSLPSGAGATPSPARATTGGERVLVLALVFSGERRYDRFRANTELWTSELSDVLSWSAGGTHGIGL
jgi:hypothetical protein